MYKRQLLVFLVLAALYESLTLPLAVILIVPRSILAALTGVYLTGNDNNIFTQIGLMVLVLSLIHIWPPPRSGSCIAAAAC